MICRYKIKFISDIEQKIRKLLVNIAVAPFVGVWIEIVSNEVEILNRKESLPLWECGLKYMLYRMCIRTMKLMKESARCCDGLR